MIYVDLSAPIRTLYRTVKIVESYMGSCRRNITEAKREIKNKQKYLKSEKARLKRLEMRRPMYEKGAKILEKELFGRKK